MLKNIYRVMTARNGKYMLWGIISMHTHTNSEAHNNGDFHAYDFLLPPQSNKEIAVGIFELPFKPPSYTVALSSEDMVKIIYKKIPREQNGELVLAFYFENLSTTAIKVTIREKAAIYEGVS
ncbi:MAG TPA: hypothetical protein VD907_01745 [Verrucomicrobiae bacterium]|nr:hypothetical protein [Verrucomicrobiae bacterium]